MIATSAKVDLKGIDEMTVEKVGGEGYFTREKKQDKTGEEAFFKQGEKPEVSLLRKPLGYASPMGTIVDWIHCRRRRWLALV